MYVVYVLLRTLQLFKNLREPKNLILQDFGKINFLNVTVIVE